MNSRLKRALIPTLLFLAGCSITMGTSDIGTYCSTDHQKPDWVDASSPFYPSQSAPLVGTYVFKGQNEFGQEFDVLLANAKKDALDSNVDRINFAVKTSLDIAVANSANPMVQNAYRNLGGKKVLLVSSVQSIVLGSANVLDYWYDCTGLRMFAVFGISAEEVYSSLSRMVMKYKDYFLPSASDQDAIYLTGLFVIALQRSLIGGQPIPPYYPPAPTPYYPPYPPYPNGSVNNRSNLGLSRNAPKSQIHSSSEKKSVHSSRKSN